MTAAIREIIQSAGFLLCPGCDGNGEVGYFCGHSTTETCYKCAGHGVVRSLEKQKHRKPCRICSGRGGLGCCDHKGYHEWESYELFKY